MRELAEPGLALCRQAGQESQCVWRSAHQGLEMWDAACDLATPMAPGSARRLDSVYKGGSASASALDPRRTEPVHTQPASPVPTLAQQMCGTLSCCSLSIQKTDCTAALGPGTHGHSLCPRGAEVGRTVTWRSEPSPQNPCGSQPLSRECGWPHPPQGWSSTPPSGTGLVQSLLRSAGHF